MNQISTTSTRVNRPKPVFAICIGIIFGATCFFAGRISVHPTYINVDPNAANDAVGVRRDAGGSRFYIARHFRWWNERRSGVKAIMEMG